MHVCLECGRTVLPTRRVKLRRLGVGYVGFKCEKRVVWKKSVDTFLIGVHPPLPGEAVRPFRCTECKNPGKYVARACAVHDLDDEPLEA